MARRIVRVIDPEWNRPSVVGRFDDVAQLRREPAGADDLDRPCRSAEAVRSASNHVHVELGNDRVAAHRRIVHEPRRAEQSTFLGGVPDEKYRAPRAWTRGERLRDLEGGDRARSIVVSAVVDRIEARGPEPAETVEDRAYASVLLRSRHTQWSLPAIGTHDHVERAQRVVIDRASVVGDVVAVRADRDELPAQPGIGPSENSDDVPRRCANRLVEKSDLRADGPPRCAWPKRGEC